MKWLRENQLNSVKLNGCAPWLCVHQAEQGPAERHKKFSACIRPVFFFSLFWLADCGQGCVQHYGTSRCNTWPCGHQDKLDLLKARNRADARTLLTCGPSTSWLIHMLTRFSCHTICSEACQSWDFTATDALITSVLQLSRCDKTPQSLCTQQRKHSHYALLYSWVTNNCRSSMEMWRVNKLNDSYVFLLVLPVKVRGPVKEPNSIGDGHSANKSIRVRAVCQPLCGLQVFKCLVGGCWNAQ